MVIAVSGKCGHQVLVVTELFAGYAPRLFHGSGVRGQLWLGSLEPMGSLCSTLQKMVRDYPPFAGSQG